MRSTTDKSRLFLTAELRAVDALVLPSLDKVSSGLLAVNVKRFPPVEEVIAVLDRTASRALVA